MPAYQHSFGAKLFGSPGVGKSCLAQRLSQDTFTESYTPTSASAAKIWSSRVPVQGREIELKICDAVSETEAIPRFYCAKCNATFERRSANAHG